MRRSHGMVIATPLLAGCFLFHESEPAVVEPDAGTPADWGVPAEPAPCAPGTPCDCRAASKVPAGEHVVGADVQVECDAECEWLHGPPLHEPPHVVTLTRDAWIGRFEATAGCYGRCVREGACSAGEVVVLPGRGEEDLRPGYWSRPDNALLPLVFVSHDGAAEHCAWLGGRLPTSAEWEKAARGPHGKRWPWAEDPPPDRETTISLEELEELAYEWEFGDPPAYEWRPGSGLVVMPVGSFPDGAGPYGHLDLVGNALEWVSDWVAPYSAEREVDPHGPSEPDPAFPNHRTVRPLDWWIWGRDYMVPSFDGPSWHGYVGFRCAFDAPPEPLPMWETMDVAER